MQKSNRTICSSTKNIQTQAVFAYASKAKLREIVPPLSINQEMSSQFTFVAVDRSYTKTLQSKQTPVQWYGYD